MGRGVAYSIIGRALFIFSAYIIHIYAGRRLGPESYGTFGVVLSILTMSYILLNNGVRQAISKIIALNPTSAKNILRKGLLVQFAIACSIAIAISGFASKFVEFFKDPSLLLPLRICGAIILTQGMFFIFAGALNGLKRFFSESFLYSTYSIVRLGAVLVFIGLGYGVSGAVLGFLIASVVAVATGLIFLANTANKPVDITVTDLFRYCIANFLIFGSAAVLLNIDLLFVKRFITEGTSAGLYTAAAAFSKPPFWFLFAFGSVALPLVASSFGKGDLPQCRVYFSQALRYSTLIFLPIVVIISATAKDLMVFFYTSEYEAAGLPLSILIFGIWFVGLVAIMANIMIGIGKERLMGIMSVFTIVLDVILIFFLVPKLGLIGASLATSLSAFVLLIGSGWCLIKKIGLDISPLTIFRLLSLVTIIYFIPQISSFSRIPLLLQYVILYFGFALGLLISGEIGPEDWLVIKRLIQPRTQA